jgi:signal transduction histidine kinase
MVRNLAFAIGCASVLVLVTARSVPTAQTKYASESDAKAMLDKEKALEMFNKGEGGFRDRDLYVFCANASDGVITAHPDLKGEHLQDIVGKKGFPVGKEIMQNATEGQIKEVTYFWPRPGTEKPLEKRSFYTKVAGQNCGVGFYKD